MMRCAVGRLMLSRRGLITGAAALAALLLGVLGPVEAQSARKLLLLGRSANTWVKPGAVIDEIFTTGQYFPRSITSELSDVRSTSKYLTNASGLLLLVGSNVLPISNAGMLVEPSAINLQPYSQAFATGSWTPVSVSLSNNIILAPDGTTTGATQTANGGNLTHFMYGPGLSSATNYAVSAYVSAGSERYVNVGLAYAATGVWVTVDTVAWSLSAITTSGSASGISSSITSNANGYHRISVVGSLASASPAPYIANANAATTAANFPVFASSNTVQAWGVDVEANNQPTSYIPTLATSATRAADAITIQRTGIGRIVFTFDDNSQQTISGINTGAQYSIPTNLNRSLITRMTGYAS